MVFFCLSFCFGVGFGEGDCLRGICLLVRFAAYSVVGETSRLYDSACFEDDADV